MFKFIYAKEEQISRAVLSCSYDKRTGNWQTFTETI